MKEFNGQEFFLHEMNGLGGHYVKWNKPGRERQILYDVTYM